MSAWATSIVIDGRRGELIWTFKLNLANHNCYPQYTSSLGAQILNYSVMYRHTGKKTILTFKRKLSILLNKCVLVYLFNWFMLLRLRLLSLPPQTRTRPRGSRGTSITPVWLWRTPSALMHTLWRLDPEARPAKLGRRGAHTIIIITSTPWRF